MSERYMCNLHPCRDYENFYKVDDYNGRRCTFSEEDYKRLEKELKAGEITAIFSFCPVKINNLQETDVMEW